MYLVDTKSAYTMQQLKGYKGLDAYKYATCGWVKQVAVKVFGSYVVVLGKVLHSQRLNEPMLQPWIIAEKEGNICSAHCTCIAGLGEVCTHVGALLFTVELNVRDLEETTVTGKKAYWMPPSGKPAQPQRVSNIDFSVPKKRLPRDEPLTVRDKGQENIPSLSRTERQELLNLFASTSQGSAAHLITNPFAQSKKEERDQKKKHWITTLFSEDHIHKSL
nr:PREDICTED: uncharacterized protein LOC103314164 [Tribolium castaneum]|eukprot:XP_008197544.2 PREDICTED: uncharacterized protein LOC103314164 [Tribolium castaneum]